MTRASEAQDDKRLLRGAACVVAFALDLAPETFFRPTRGSTREAEARQILLAVVRRAAAISRHDITVQRLGRAIGRDRTSVAHALSKIENACEVDGDVDAFVDALADLTRKLLAISAVSSAAIADAERRAATEDEPP